MAVIFSRTTHAVNNEPYNLITQIGIIIASIIMLFWCIWFFYGSIYHYVTSQSVTITEQAQPVWRIPDANHKVKGFQQYTITAHFSHKYLSKIQPHQLAVLYVQDDSTLPAHPFKLEVKSIDKHTAVVHLKLEIDQDNHIDNKVLKSKEQARVEIAVMRQSPAAFLFHTVTSKKQ
ncbi:MAG: hypothetical protein R8K21_05490 [Mariprofundales bacterium]